MYIIDFSLVQGAKFKQLCCYLTVKAYLNFEKKCIPIKEGNFVIFGPKTNLNLLETFALFSLC